MEEDFAQGTTPLGALRGILGNYPYSVGLLREMLQNSDDAGATKQTFVLDRRSHPTESLYNPKLARTQGPAFLAYNDAKFNAADWHALKSVYESSKAVDSSKIGKYGVGFRSIFHITDCPQIVSGEVFAMFDPLKAFTDSAGKKLLLAHVVSQHPSQLVPFEWIMHSQTGQSEFNGTVIRCPLRQEASRISSKVVAADDIAHLFREFIFEEIEISLLFLQNIQHIEIYDIDAQGVSSRMIQLSIARSSPISCGDNNKTYTATVTTTNEDQRIWRIVQCPFHQDEAIQLLSRGSNDPSSILKENKLLPHIGIAAPLDATADDQTAGRLFTFLPLPLPTGFPAHIHAYFALTQSRQNLRNSKEIGLIPGTDDHIFIEWNKLLFEHYIPQAWKLFLEVLANKDHTLDIFSVWPPEQRLEVTSGENVYWKNLPANLLNFIASSNSAIWPVFHEGAQPQTEYQSLDSLITAEPSLQDCVLRALTAVGLRLTCPPRYIVELIKNSGQEICSILTPEEAHKGLLVQLDLLKAASKDKVSIILEYLLSTKNVFAILELPIIPVTSGRSIALSSAHAGSTVTYTMLNRTEFDVFGACDDNAIVLHLLPMNVAETLQHHGPGSLNVTTLDVPSIIDYLTIYPNRLGLDLSRTEPLAITWLSAFWIWVTTYVHKDQLFPQIQHLFLLPSSRGLRKAETPLFKSRGEHPVYVQHFTSLGVPFLDVALLERAQGILASFGLLKNISDIHALLDSIPGPATLGTKPTLSKEACETILKYISLRASGSFNNEQTCRLRSLPIFPVVHQPELTGNPSPKLTVEWTSLPDQLVIRSVKTPTFLPAIEGNIFVQLSPIAPDILRHLGDASSLSDVDLLYLTAEHFTQQSSYVQAATLQYIIRDRWHIPPHVLEMLRNMEFVFVKDGSRRKPSDVVDPDSSIACLYIHNLAHQIRRTTVLERTIVQALQSLGLLRSKLTIDIVRDTIDIISSQPLHSGSTGLSRALLSLIGKAHLDYSQLNIPPGKKWLPTNEGLQGSADCRDGSQFPPRLFNRVLAVLDPFNIPSSLKKCLGWDQLLPAEILIRQLDQVLQELGDIFSIVVDILNELGKRELAFSDFGSLQTATANRRWVPTTDRQLSEVVNAVFLQPTSGSGFHQIYPVDPRTQDLLCRMGCIDSPSSDAIIAKLEELSQHTPSLNAVNVALSLLRSVPSDLDDEERSRLLIPDTMNYLRPFMETFFNDIGEQSRLTPSGSSFISHPLLDESLSRKLGLGRLGLRYSNLTVPHVDMGEKPVITVRKNLAQYTEKQFVGEFFANAADAGATEFTLMLNDFCGDAGGDIRALSPIMAKFCFSPSIVVHNNSIFTDEDFEGICRTSVGGKGAKRDKIGQFGLGALTMFHFTELAMVVSHDKILFLNPSKAHLPVSGLAALIIPLNHVRRFYPSQLKAIDGLFGFDLSSDGPYSGTIFLLPLREDTHCEEALDLVSRITWTTADIRLGIMKHFQELAPNCLLFTEMQKIQGIIREASGDQKIAWCHTALRDPNDIESATGFSVGNTLITDSSNSTTIWTVAKTVVLGTRIPEELQLFAVERRLRFPPVAGLAMLNGDSSGKRNLFKFFSTLPLGISTSLPLHVMASFVLSSDRRQIRLDEYGGPETRYNRWLLSEVVPSLYLFLLEHLLQLEDEGGNRGWWPQHRNDDDIYSRLIVESFYSLHLRDCNRRIFRSMNHPSRCLTPQEAVMSGDEPSNISIALSALDSDRTVNIPTGARHLAIEKAAIAKVTPAFLKEEILKEPSAITQSDFKVLENVILYLSPKPEDSTHLLGLPILPLEDGTFGTFENKEHPTRYFVWIPRKPGRPLNFPLQHFIHHQLKVRDILKMDLNVLQLNSVVIRSFIEAKFQGISPSDVAPEVSHWIYDFWETWPEYDHLGMDRNDILDFPLVPTVRPQVFVSLGQCKDGSALLVGKSTPEAEMLRGCLDQLDLKVVRPDDEPTPLALRLILKNQDYPSLTFEHFLTALAKISDQTTIAENFESLDDNVQNTFASWARESIQHTQQIPDPVISVAQQLPIWRSARSGSVAKLRCASEIHMLPSGITMPVAARFMNIFVANHGKLKLMNGPSLTFEQLEDNLDLPSILGTSDLSPYKTLLDAWIKHLPGSYGRSMPIPNDNRNIMQSDQLYARQPLFEAAFGEDPDRFIHADFADLEPLLHKHGLRTENQLDVQMFRNCAEAINSREGDDRAIRAGVLFEAYGFQLPMRVGANEKASWHELDSISFIPRKMIQTRRLEEQNGGNGAALDIPEGIRRLSDVVAPLNLVRKEYEAIAWTQKAFFSEQPHQRVLIAHPALGRPTISDVIEHLRALSAFHDLSTAQRRILLHDLTATYDYLNDNISTATEAQIAQLALGNIFLNVDDPAEDEWKWDNADQLVFEMQDTEAYVRCVRTFLLPFSKLLRTAGVLQVYHPQYIGEPTANSETAKLEAIRSGFDRLRKENVLTDVVFIAQPEDPEPGEAAGDSSPLLAHRAFLAVSSEYFSDSFSGGFAESRPASPGDPVQINVADYSRRCVRLVLEFIYTGAHSTIETFLDLLLETMQLSGYWRIMDLFEEMQKEIVVRKLITPRTLDSIREAAELAHADNLLRTCAEYEEKNSAFIRKFRQSAVPDAP